MSLLIQHQYDNSSIDIYDNAGRALGGAANQAGAQKLQDLVQRVGQQLPMPEYTQSALNKQAAAQSAWNMMKGK
jgi:hypothetical protein